jgi:hypothetical protein
MSEGTNREQRGFAPEDVDDLVRKIHAGTERGRRIGSMRPDGSQVAQMTGAYTGLLWLALLEQQESHLPAHLVDGNDWETSRWYPAPSSVGAIDLLWGEDLESTWHGNPIRDSIDIAEALFRAGIDHLNGAIFLLGNSPLVMSPISAARSALEAFSMACFMLDPAASPLERLRRSTNFRLQELDESRRNYADEDRPQEVEIQRLLDLARESGLNGTWAKDRKVPFLKNQAGQTDSIGWIIDKVLESSIGVGFYRSMSTVTHSQDRSIITMLEIYERLEEQYARNAHVALMSLPSIVAMLELKNRLQHYLGWDLQDATDLDDGLLACWAAAAGLADEVIASSMTQPTADQTE